MYKQFGDDVEFLMVYIREAHPVDGRQSRSNESEAILFLQPTNLDERTEVCKEMCQKLNISIPAVVDRLDDRVNQAYGALPDRLYLVGRDGRIAYKGDRGPRGFRPEELKSAIKKELAR